MADRSKQTREVRAWRWGGTVGPSQTKANTQSQNRAGLKDSRTPSLDGEEGFDSTKAAKDWSVQRSY